MIPRNAGKRSTFHILIISNIISVLMHLTRDLPLPEDDGFLYGHHTLQVIGQTQLPNKYYFLLLDLLVFYMQLALFTSQYSSKKHKNIRSSLMEAEYDGYQGKTTALKIPIISALNLPFPSVEELKLEEEEESQTRHQQQNQEVDDNLLAEQIVYGSISNELDEEDELNAVI